MYVLYSVISHTCVKLLSATQEFPYLVQTGVINPEDFDLDVEDLVLCSDSDYTSSEEDPDDEELRQGKSLAYVFNKWGMLGRVERKVG